MARLRSPRRSRKMVILLLFGVLGWLGYTAVRSRILLLNGREIAAHSTDFPREFVVGDARNPSLRLLVMGDSTAAGWGAANVNETYPHQIAQNLAARGFQVRVVNVARGGATLSDVRRDQLGALQKLQPDVITLSVGANDTTRGTSLSVFERDLKLVLSELKRSRASTILVANTPDMFQVPALPLPVAWAVNRRAQKLNEAFARTLRAARAREVDLYERGKLIYRRNPDFYASDLFHPSSEGYNVWAKLFIEKLPHKLN